MRITALRFCYDAWAFNIDIRLDISVVLSFNFTETSQREKTKTIKENNFTRT